MYAALNKDNKLVYAIEADRLEEFFCAKCLKPVKLIQHNDKAYFQHQNDKFNVVNEREIHQLGKEILVKDFEQLGYQEIKRELFLSQINQRPDLSLTNRIVLEYQCAIINTSKLKKRIDGYKKMGIKSIWVLGGSYLDNKVVKKHLKFLSYDPNWGFYLLMLDSKTGIYQLFFHIRFSGLFNKITYNKKIFYTGKLNELFKFKTEIKSYPLLPVDHYQIQRIRNLRGVKVDNLKESFFNQRGKTVEEFLIGQTIDYQKPIYSNHYWKILCGEAPKYLEQPLLYKKK